MAFEQDSSQTFEYTFHESKLTCWKPFYTAHMIFAYLIFISGLLCFLTRLHPKLNIVHVWMGRLYIMFMLWGTATSLLIHNTGLPIGVLWSFLWVMLGLCLGWIAIGIHQRHRGLFRGLFKRQEGEVKKETKWRIVIRKFFTLKTLHGALMFMSWINIAGRVFVTPPDANFECWTYAAFKPIPGSKHYNYTAGDPIKLVPQDSVNYSRAPWAYREGAWAAMLSLLPLFGALAVGFIYLSITTKEVNNSLQDETRVDVESKQLVAAMDEASKPSTTTTLLLVDTSIPGETDNKTK